MDYDEKVSLEDTKEIGIKFTLNRSSENIEVKGSWNNWTIGSKLYHLEGTHESGKFVYSGRIRIPCNITSIEYKFVVDGIW